MDDALPEIGTRWLDTSLNDAFRVVSHERGWLYPVRVRYDSGEANGLAPGGFVDGTFVKVKALA